MTTFVKIALGVVVQKQPYAAAGFVEAPDWVICGMVFDGEVFALPPVPDPVPSDFTLTKRQISAALILSGTTTDPNGFITGIIAAITDATQRALALNDWQNAPFYRRDHQLFNDPDLLTAAGMTSANIDALWMLAKDQPV